MTRQRRWLMVANPLAQLSVGAFALVASFWIRDLSVALVALGCYACAIALFAPSWRYPLVALASSGIAAVTVVYSTWRLGGHQEHEAITAGIRILVLAWPGSVAAGHIDPARLGDFLAQTLHLPARMVAAFSAALQRFASFGHAWTEIERARRVRGAGPNGNPLSWFGHAGHMAFAMLLHALRGSLQTAIAMDARGFASAQQRTWAEPAVWTRVDAVVVAVGAGLGLVAPVASLVIGWS